MAMLNNQMVAQFQSESFLGSIQEKAQQTLEAARGRFSGHLMVEIWGVFDTYTLW